MYSKGCKEILFILCSLLYFNIYGQEKASKNKYQYPTDIDLSPYTFDKSYTVETNYDYSNKQNKSINKEKKKFVQVVRFDSSEFLKVCISGSKFTKPALFSKSRYISEVILSDLIFIKEVSADSAEFRRPTSFTDIKFQSSFQFIKSDVYSDMCFNRTQFYENAEFCNTTYRSKTIYGNCHFMGYADFSNCKIESQLCFNECRFKSALKLSGLKAGIATEINFDGTILPDTIDFSDNAALPTILDIDFTKAKFASNKSTQSNWLDKAKEAIMYYFVPNLEYHPKKKHYINLFNTNIYCIKIDNDHFTPYSRNNKSAINTSPDDVEELYSGLLKNFEKRGQMESYKYYYIKSRYLKSNNYYTSFVVDWWWRFGYEKWRILIHSFLFILAYSIFIFFRIDRYNDKNRGVYHIEKIPEFSPLNKRILSFRYVVKRFKYSFLYSGVLFFMITLKIDKINFTQKGLFVIIWIYTTGLICMGFMANIILQKL